MSVFCFEFYLLFLVYRNLLLTLILKYEGLEDIADEIVIKQGLLSDERLDHITHEKEIILAEQNPEEYFNFCEKNRDDQSGSIG